MGIPGQPLTTSQIRAYNVITYYGENKEMKTRLVRIGNSRGIRLPELAHAFGSRTAAQSSPKKGTTSCIQSRAMVLEVEMYTDEQVLAWDEADRLDDVERQTVLRHLAARQ